jgi:uncharacterized protein YdhG (YjbR/CyaY superfamily)
MTAGKPATIDAYIAAQSPVLQPILSEVRAAIHKALPDAAEVISYGIPAFKRQGRTVIYFAGWKAHYSLYPVGDAVVAAFGDEISAYKRSKGTLRLPLNHPVPDDLITRIAAFLDVEATA